MRRIAWAWQHYPRSTQSKYLVDYGDNKRQFLEAVPSYISVIPALQAGNAGMMLSLARLLEKVGSPAEQAEISQLRGNASAIITDLGNIHK